MSRSRNSPDVEHPERDPATVAGRCAVLAGDRPGPRVLSARQSGPSAMPGQWLGGREDGHAVAGGSSYDGWHVWGGRLGQLAGGRGFADGREELLESGGSEKHKAADLGGLRVETVRLSPGQGHTLSLPPGEGGVTADRGCEAGFEDVERI